MLPHPLHLPHSLLLAAAPCADAARRVRKELRSLSSMEFRALILGLSTMNTISTEVGRKIFGPQYISYMEMMMKHAVAVNDPRGDQVWALATGTSPSPAACPLLSYRHQRCNLHMPHARNAMPPT